MKELQALFDEIAAQGRNGDTMLAHINPQEAELLKALGGSGTINPETGLPEFWGWSSVRDSVLGAPAAAVNTVNDVVIDPTLSVVKDAGETIDNVIVKPVGNVLSWAKENPVEAALLVAGGYYFAPEIGAWMSADGAAIAGTEAGTEAGTWVVAVVEDSPSVAEDSPSVAEDSPSVAAVAEEDTLPRPSSEEEGRFLLREMHPRSEVDLAGHYY
jgi:hypothetical protein